MPESPRSAILTISLGLRASNGRSTNALYAVKTAVLTAMPTARERIVMAVDQGLRDNARIPYLRSRSIVSGRINRIDLVETCATSVG